LALWQQPLYINYNNSYLELSFKMELTKDQRKRIEENRNKALLIRNEKLKARTTVQPYPKYLFVLKNIIHFSYTYNNNLY